VCGWLSIGISTVVLVLLVKQGVNGGLLVMFCNALE
jgi:hypothetical protein